MGNWSLERGGVCPSLLWDGPVRSVFWPPWARHAHGMQTCMQACVLYHCQSYPISFQFLAIPTAQGTFTHALLLVTPQGGRVAGLPASWGGGAHKTAASGAVAEGPGVWAGGQEPPQGWPQPTHQADGGVWVPGLEPGWGHLGGGSQAVGTRTGARLRRTRLGHQGDIGSLGLSLFLAWCNQDPFFGVGGSLSCCRELRRKELICDLA